MIQNKVIKIIAIVGVIGLMTGFIYFVFLKQMERPQVVAELANTQYQVGKEISIKPEEVKNWIENSLKFDMGDFANAKEFNGRQYLFVRSGIGGFRDGPKPFERLVQIIDVLVLEDEVAVKTSFTKPSPTQQIMPDALYDVAYIKATGLPVRFVPVADEEIFIRALSGIHYLPDIVAQSRAIKIFAPAPNEVVERRFSVTGVANVFEATLHYQLLDANQNTLAGGFRMVGQLAPGFTRETITSHLDGGAANWLYFNFDLTVPEFVPSGTDLVLNLYWLSPKDGATTDIVAIPLKFELN